MSTRHVERELAAILQRRAEDAMNRTDTQTELLELNATVEERSRRDRRRWAAGGALAAAAALVVGFSLWPGDGNDDPQPADEPDQQTAERIADGFVEAVAAGDVATAESYVAPGAMPWPGWRKQISEDGVLAPVYLPRPCEAAFTSEAGTRVTCPFDYHLLRSEELGMRPFAGNEFTVMVDGGKVVSADEFRDWFDNGQSILFEELGAWVRQHHPGDWAAMNIPGDGTLAEQRRAARLWEQHTQEYVDAQAAQEATE